MLVIQQIAPVPADDCWWKATGQVDQKAASLLSLHWFCPIDLACVADMLRSHKQRQQATAGHLDCQMLHIKARL